MMLENFLTPITITFFVIAVGYYIGKIKIFNISLDLSAVLVLSVITGYLIATTFSSSYISDMQMFMKSFSSLGTALFVSTIGISSGYLMKSYNRKDIISLLVGCAMAVAGLLTMKVISCIDKNVSYSGLLGALCGALTSTPGLSAVCELKEAVSSDAILGYGSTYLFGVIFTVIFVQIISKNTMVASDPQKSVEAVHRYSGIFEGLLQICLTAILGTLLGSVKIPIINFSLGSSGGILCIGIVLGYVVQKKYPKCKDSSQSFSFFRNLGLILFFVGSGIPAGMNLNRSFYPQLVGYGLVMTIISIFIGYIACKVIAKYSRVSSASIVAGGMTSTPAMAILLKKNNSSCDLSSYSFAYIGALLTIIIGVRLI